MPICNERVSSCQLSQLPELVFVEGDEDAYDFKPCYQEPYPPPPNPYAYRGDQLLLDGEPVCWGDPALEAYLTDKGLRGNEWPARNLSLSGSYRSIWADARRILEDEPAMAAITAPTATEAQRLAAMDHIGRYVMCDGDFQDEEDEDLRDAAIYALQHDPSDEVRVRAAVVLREIKQLKWRCYGDKIREAMRTAMDSDVSAAVRSELAWAWACFPLDELANSPRQYLPVREIAALGMIRSYYYPHYGEAFVAMAKDPKQPVRLRVAILKTLKSYLRILEPPPEGHYTVHSSGAYAVAEHAKYLLGEYGPLGDGNFDVSVAGVAQAIMNSMAMIANSSEAVTWRSPQPRPEPAGFRDYTCGVDQR